MIKSDEISLLEIGQQASPGIRRFTCQAAHQYLLLMCGIRTVFRINDKQYYMQPFTFLLHPLSEQDVAIESQGMTAYRYMRLELSDQYLQHVHESGLNFYDTHTLAQPLAVEEIWKLLLPAMETNTRLGQEMGGHALHLLFCLLMEASDGTVTRAAEVPHYDKLTALRHSIYSNPASSWYIQDICDDLGISRPYFHKIYLAAFGTTCTQDVIASRIAFSKRLLETTDDAISAVSQQCGFETDVYFMRQFKRHVGMTPTAYRRVYRQSALSAENQERG